MATVALAGAAKTYPNGFVAIPGMDLQIDDGELLVLVGPSGCGKSTLLRMVAGLETVTGGEISIGERRVNDLEPAQRDIAMVFQNYALYPHMSVYDNMAYGLRNRRVPRDEIETRVNEAARILELEALLKRKPRQLSGGQRQRVAMGRAIVREPAVFLFDEPLSNLDAKLRVQMRLEIKRLQRRLGVTAIYVTHDQVEAMTLADRLVVMNAGVAEQVGTPMEVYARPSSRFVAGFIGSPAMNFLPATVTGGGRRAALAGDGAPELELGAALPGDGAAVSLGVRPEDLIIEAQGGSGPNRLCLRVDLVEPLGAETLLHGRVEPGGDPITLRIAGAREVEEGSELTVHAPPDALHPFDAEDGRRLESVE